MSSQAHEFYFDAPEQIRWLKDGEFREFCHKAAQSYEFLFRRGVFAGDEPRYLGDKAISWMIHLEDTSQGGIVNLGR